MRTRTEGKRIEILEAAARTFASREFHEVLIDRVAADAGVGKGTIYRYFETKEDLYFATILHGFDALARALSDAPPSNQDPETRLERIAEGVIRFFWTREDFSKLLMEDGRRFRSRQEELSKRKEALQLLVERTLADGVTSGAFQVSSVRAAAILFRGMIRAALDAHRPEDTPESLAAAIVGIFVRGVGRLPS
ncbi:MAG: TetR/AcrR family transcriptional regulator [Acidobacteriota bacterium]|nr:TetR/AcrR family transcriptional regulator [Acidobacteriota bacterium]